MANKPIKITRLEADKIIIDWQKEGRPYKKVVLNFAGKWYDVRKLTEEEIIAFMEKLTGQKIDPKQIINLQI